MEDFPEGPGYEGWREAAGLPSSSWPKTDTATTEVQDSVGYNVKFFYRQGEVDQATVDRLKEGFSRLSYVQTEDKDAFFIRTSPENFDPTSTSILNIRVYIDYRFQNLVDAHAEAVVSENDFLLFIEDSNTGFSNPLVDSRSFLIKCGSRAVQLLKWGLEIDPEFKSSFGKIKGDKAKEIPFALSQDILSQLERTGSFKGVKTSMDTLLSIADGLTYVVMSINGGAASILSTILLSLVVEPLKNMTSIQGFDWDPDDPAWKPGSSAAKMNSPHPDNWLVWYKKPVKDPNETYFKPYFLSWIWPKDGAVVFKALDIVSGVEFEKWVSTYFNQGIKNRIEEIRTKIKSLYAKNRNSIIENLEWCFSTFGIDVRFVINWVETQVNRVMEALGKMSAVLERAMEENRNYWFQSKNRLVVLNAFLCGIYNSIIDSILGIPELIGSLFKFSSFMSDVNISMSQNAKFATEIGEDFQDAWFPPHGAGSFNLDNIIDQTLALSKECVNIMIKVGGYLAKEITLVRVAYFVGAIVEFILEIIVSILVTFGFGLVLSFLKTLGKTGAVIQKIIQAAVKLKKLVDVVPNLLVEVLLGWLGKLSVLMAKFVRGKGDDLLVALKKINKQLTGGVDELIRPDIVREVRDGIGVDLDALQRQSNLHFSDFKEGTLRLIRDTCT